MLALVLSLVVAAPCRPHVTELVVLTSAHHLYLCHDGSAEADYPVALGSGGVDKKREGDAKTPLGVYPLAAPRASTSFHTFIYLGYPTEQQRQSGLTGSDVGVHGPARGFENLGVANIATDWTLGCIALSSDKAIDDVAAWVKRVKCGVIRLE